MFYMWLNASENSAGDLQFPNINVAQGVLECLGKLNLQRENIVDSKNLVNILEYYADKKNKDIHPIAKKLASDLKRKWDLQLMGQINYDSDEADRAFSNF